MLNMLQASAAVRGCALLVITLLAEEIHAPAARISVAPARLRTLRVLLSGHAVSLFIVLSDMLAKETHCWPFCASQPFRAARAWCAAGLARGDAVLSSSLLISDALRMLHQPPTDESESIAADASEALCAAIDSLRECVILDQKQSMCCGAADSGGAFSNTQGSEHRANACKHPDVEDSLTQASALVQYAAALLPALESLPRRRDTAEVVGHMCEALGECAVACRTLLHAPPEVDADRLSSLQPAAAIAAQADSLLQDWMAALLEVSTPSDRHGKK